MYEKIDSIKNKERLKKALEDAMQVTEKDLSNCPSTHELHRLRIKAINQTISQHDSQELQHHNRAEPWRLYQVQPTSRIISKPNYQEEYQKFLKAYKKPSQPKNSTTEIASQSASIKPIQKINEPAENLPPIQPEKKFAPSFDSIIQNAPQFGGIFPAISIMKQDEKMMPKVGLFKTNAEQNKEPPIFSSKKAENSSFQVQPQKPPINLFSNIQTIPSEKGLNLFEKKTPTETVKQIPKINLFSGNALAKNTIQEKQTKEQNKNISSIFTNQNVTAGKPLLFPENPSSNSNSGRSIFSHSEEPKPEKKRFFGIEEEKESTPSFFKKIQQSSIFSQQSKPKVDTILSQQSKSKVQEQKNKEETEKPFNLFNNVPQRKQSSENQSIFKSQPTSLFNVPKNEGIFSASGMSSSSENKPEPIFQIKEEKLNIFKNQSKTIFNQTKKSESIFPSNESKSSQPISLFSKPEKVPIFGQPQIKEEKSSIFTNQPVQQQNPNSQANIFKQKEPVVEKQPLLQKPNQKESDNQKKFFFGNPSKSIFGKQQEPSSIQESNSQPPQQSIFGKPSSIFNPAPAAQQKSDRIFPQTTQNIFDSMKSKPQIFSGGNTAQPENKNIFGQTSQTPLFGKSNNTGGGGLFDKKEDEQEEAEEGEDGLYKTEEEAIDPSKSTGTYEYEKSEVLFKEVVSKLRKGTSDLQENVTVSIEKLHGSENKTMYVRMPNKCIYFMGMIVRQFTEASQIKAGNAKNISVKKIISTNKEKPTPELLKIQFKEEKHGKAFLEAFQ